jgi:hypothetical protein
MGWSLNIRSSRPIDADDVDAALRDIGADHIRQSWGWASLHRADVSNPSADGLTVSGAWYSFGGADDFAAELADRLTGRGYDIVDVGKADG